MVTGIYQMIINSSFIGLYFIYPLFREITMSEIFGLDAFIGLGGLYFVLIKSDATLGFTTSQVLGGVHSRGFLAISTCNHGGYCRWQFIFCFGLSHCSPTKCRLIV